MRPSWRAPLLVVGLLLAAPAHAEPKDDARRHFAEGLESARAGDYEAALGHFQAAQAAWPHPATLYNIAKAYTDLGRIPEALETYRLYRAAAPDKAADVDPILAVLEARLRADAAPTPAPGDPSAPEPGAAATVNADQVRRLEQLVVEIGAITEQLRSEAPAPAPATPAPSDVAPPAPGDPAPIELPTDFQEQAYERVVVTASRVAQAPLDSPSTLAVITAEEIRRAGASDVPDLLRRLAGVDVMQLSAGHADVAIRGFQRKLNNKVLVLIDGRSTYIDFLGTTFWSSFPIELEEIERIEVIRGPGSAVYGANAVTGVINVITRAPGEGGQVVALDAGTPGLVRTSAVTSGRAGPTAWRLSAGLQRHGRWAEEPAADADSPAVEPFFGDSTLAIDGLRANARVDRTLGKDAAVSVSGGLAQTKNEFFNLGALPNYGLDLQHHYLRADAFLKAVHLRTFWNANRGATGPWQSYVGARELDAEFDNEVVDVELEAPLSFDVGRTHHQLAAGGGWRYKNIRFDYLQGGFDRAWVENHYQGFVNEQATVGRLGLVASLRVDAHPLIPISQTVSPRGAVLLRVADHTSVRATAGSAYRAPSAVESYMAFALPTPIDGAYLQDFGNQELRPERIATFELGVHDESSNAHVADVVVYVERVTNLVDLAPATPALEPFDAREGGVRVGTTGWVNEDAVYTAAGGEVDARVFPVDGLDLFATTAVRRTFVTGGLAGDEVDVDRSVAELAANAGVTWRSPWRVDLSAAGHYRSETEWGLRDFDPATLGIVVTPESVAPRLLVSARLAARPFPEEDLEVGVVVWNPLAFAGDPYPEHPEGQPLYGRAFGQLAWRF
jgi:outer membrane receptor protein involved in Fe transport